MRRLTVVLAVLLVLLLAGDRVVRVRIEEEVERSVARSFSAATVDADVTGLLVLPQLLVGRLERVDIVLGDGMVGEPPTRVTSLAVSLVGAAVGFPPPSALDRVGIDEGTIVIRVHEREVERLLAREHAGWTVQIGDATLHATGHVQGVEVRVVGEVVTHGQTLRLRAREVDAGALGPGAVQAVAQGFDTSLTIAGLPPGVRFTQARPEAGHLVIEATIAPGVLALD